MPSDRASLKTLKSIIKQVDLILETTIELPENRTTRSRELLRTALALADDLISQTSMNPAAIMGSKGGSSTMAKLGSEHFRQLAAKRKVKGGGRPRKSEGEQ